MAQSWRNVPQSFSFEIDVETIPTDWEKDEQNAVRRDDREPVNPKFDPLDFD